MSDGAAKPSSLDDVKKIARDSSDKNRNFYIAYLALSFYVLVMALGISHKELLLNERQLPIPLLSLGLRPTIWFWVAPGMLFVMYLDVILNLREHLRKLMAWRSACGGELPPQEVPPFLVDFAFAHKRKGIGGILYHAMLWISVAMLAPFALLVCLVQFGAYQSVTTSAYHLLLVLVSLLLAAYFMHTWQLAVTINLKDDTDSNAPHFLWQKVLLSQTNWCVAALMLAAAGYGLLIERYATGHRPEVSKSFMLTPRLDVANTVLVDVNTSEKQALEILQAHQSAITTANPLNAEKSDSLASMWWKHGAKLDFTRRHLNYADLSKSLLSRSIFANAQLKEAMLFQTQLQGADLTGAQLQEAVLFNAQLQGASLISAQLQGAVLVGAQLQGADLSLAQLQRVNLSGAQLHGANLRFALLQGANLNFAKLHGAVLIDAQMQGAVLVDTQLQGASLIRAQLEGANCDASSHSGAVLKLGKTDLSSCVLNNWLIKNETQAAILEKELKANIADQNSLERLKFEVQQRIGDPIWQKALCGDLSKSMVDTIYLYKHHWNGVPDDIVLQWRKAAKPCPEPGKPV